MSTAKHKGLKIENVAKNKADWHIFSEYCKGCGLCMVKCPKKCLKWSKEVGIYQTPIVEPVSEDCIACGTCALVCPDSAIRIEKK
ncbi:2-oxoglutarate ferredoxin oxidoreductase subunit delta [Candidatus Gastranaerophilus sp. (ex Termes propinquus)]|nr:2-oxoglutarate ferredoxin oxidoreductase subunit delta [Candidatus Gastranaerophilus sp. (ex Termes propinquus)]